MLKQHLLSIVLLLSINQWTLGRCDPSDGAPLSQEPFLRDLFGEQKSDRLNKLTSCQDSVFKLNQAYETLYNMKAIYSDYLSNRAGQLSQAEERLLAFGREALPVNASANRFWHPVDAHKFILFAVREMNPKLHALINEHSGVQIKLVLQHLLDSAECWLNEASIAESMKNLFVIKSFYNLSAEDFAEGNFAGRRSEAAFSAAELMELLLHLNRQFDPEQTAELAEFLRRKRLDIVKSSLGEQPARSVYRILGKAYYQMKQFDKAIEALNEYKATAPADAERRGVDADLAYIAANQVGQPADFALESNQSATSLEREFGLSANPADAQSIQMLAESKEKFQRYRKICDPQRWGLDDLKDADMEAKFAKLSEDSLLICENWRPYNGWYPIRKEMVSKSPLIVRYSNVFNNASLIESLIAEAEKRIFEVPKEDDLAENTLNRLTQVRLHSFNKPMLPFDSNASRAIIDRVEFVTRLDASFHFQSSEKYIEVANYGHGIRNNPHIASSLPSIFYNRLAEAIIFPNENAVGGEMVYPEMGLKIPTKPSDLIVQYSYLPTYHIDKTSAGPLICPIMFGDKWVARIPLGLLTCSQDQEVVMEQWLPGTATARRRSVERSWKTLIRPQLPQPINATATLQGNETAGDLKPAIVAQERLENSTDIESSLKSPEQQQEAVIEGVKDADSKSASSADADEKDDADEDGDDQDAEK